MQKKKDQIIKFMKQYGAEDIKMLYSFMAKILLGNEDFRIAKYANNDDVRSIIEEETEQQIEFSTGSIIEGDPLSVFCQIDELDSSPKRMKKAERIELIASVFADKTLFEGFCLAFDAPDEVIHEICNDFGCGLQYEELARDSVYQARKQYMRLISSYAKAAVNLYGVIHLVELEELIKKYEKHCHRYEKYSRKNGNYANTILFTPRYMGLYTLQHLIGNMLPTIGVTLDGLILHECFFGEYQQENEELVSIMEKSKRAGKVLELDEMFDSLGYYSYRELHWIASEKPMYSPDKKEFLKYEDDLYYEVSLAEKQLRRLLGTKYISAFKKKGRSMMLSAEGCIDNFIDLVYEEATDNGKGIENSNPNEFIEMVFDLLDDYGIQMKDLNQANEIISLAMKMKNSTRLWTNHGYTPSEIMHLQPINPDELTVVPGSSVAAHMLNESKAEMAAKKVYPNDPCPCGSGKKFKKCCGKLRK